MRVVKKIGPPAGFRRVVFRLPIYLYRCGLGALLGSRLLLLTHRGRRSGKERQVVLEVAEYDRATDSYLVASGWGPTAAWYRNILDTPDVHIQVGRRRMLATALPLTKEEGAEVFVQYASRHPKAARRVLPRLMGYSVDGSTADFREVGRRLPFVRLVPR
ncbi:deazaflavin-dependent oxidoreductase (nitroreductase family) [Mycolicibacterium sp. BK556]|uniref:nitroreductase family deazaflavin-dependent oxidoreductase n=1 Tax=Mycobacteriaceae TaxID=1762 RepID=UPI00105C5586|nr:MULTISPECIES: nitroreductase family deazaflavin-dependent oxidoreductase [Mycobacteriaceae]MBB3603052.1 deazaflavin-dependent oxidoreductase (nitroreductase family) [Mycolicibacterium sp. BK556]MBB3633247.1 deazaflavin-dependent oxidoreductase (nitroreductase family) [Mycolicibacterium sp. BK607]MBB3750803.1 deazaflavin-dependent oxidoreductase (nitroreductase family) [Mycolicibacterium sp. BK634]TDO07221.1 deazaflavin-dependent oxidoreductase (nitroreductase family) [Mycobacterium sp. BK086